MDISQAPVYLLFFLLILFLLNLSGAPILFTNFRYFKLYKLKMDVEPKEIFLTCCCKCLLLLWAWCVKTKLITDFLMLVHLSCFLRVSISSLLQAKSSGITNSTPIVTSNLLQTLSFNACYSSVTTIFITENSENYHYSSLPPQYCILHKILLTSPWTFLVIRIAYGECCWIHGLQRRRNSLAPNMPSQSLRALWSRYFIKIKR